MFKQIIKIALLGIILVVFSPKEVFGNPAIKKMDSKLTMLVGTYTTGTSKGIYTFRFNENTGVATSLSSIATANPSYLTITKDGKFVYAVNELGNEQDASVSAFSLNRQKGTLTFLNSQKTEGTDPCNLITKYKHVITANYSGGSISVFPLTNKGTLLPANQVIKFNGSGPDKAHQASPHLHCVYVTPDGKYLMGNDLGSDQIHKFNINPEAKWDNKEKLLSKGTPAAFKMAPGSGPRHLVFSQNGKFAYLITELGGTVIVLKYANGIFTTLQTVAADTVGAHGSADIHISPDEKFLYASNRLKSDGIAIFKISTTKGTLTKVGYQLSEIHPRNFIITPNGKYLLVACRDSNTIQVFKRNLKTGLLTDTKKNINLDKPVCIKFVGYTR